VTSADSLRHLFELMASDGLDVEEAIKTLPLLQLAIERQLRYKTGRKPW